MGWCPGWHRNRNLGRYGHPDLYLQFWCPCLSVKNYSTWRCKNHISIHYHHRNLSHPLLQSWICLDRHRLWSESARLLNLCFRPYTMVRFSKKSRSAEMLGSGSTPKSMTCRIHLLGLCSPGGPQPFTSSQNYLSLDWRTAVWALVVLVVDQAVQHKVQNNAHTRTKCTCQ